MSYEEMVEKLISQNIDSNEIKSIHKESLNNCSLCGTELSFTHDIDHIEKQVVEHPQCPGCGIKYKVRNYLLQ